MEAAAGVAETMLRSENRDLTSMGANKPAATNGIFKDPTNVIASIKDRLGEIIEKVHIEVVAPNRELAKMMTTMSTMTRSMFLREHKKYSEELMIDTTSRPMLLSYLGLYYASDQQVSEWYARHKAHLHQKVISGCESFIRLRRQAERLSSEDLQVLKKVEGIGNVLSLVLVKFENNLNLFMIDNYLMLCSKLDPEQLREEIKKLQVRV